MIVVKQRFSILAIRFSSIYNPPHNSFTYCTFLTPCNLKVTYIFQPHIYILKKDQFKFETCRTKQGRHVWWNLFFYLYKEYSHSTSEG